MNTPISSDVVKNIIKKNYIVVATTSHNDPVVCLLQQSSYLAI